MRKPKPQAIREPEELGPNSVKTKAAPVPIAADPKNKEKVLDPYAAALASSESHQMPIGNLSEEVTGGTCTKDRLEALMRLMHSDKRFVIFSKDGLHHVKLAGTSVASKEQKSKAFLEGMAAHKAKADLFANPYAGKKGKEQEALDHEDGWMAAENGMAPQKYEQAKPAPFPSETNDAQESDDEEADDVPAAVGHEGDDESAAEEDEEDAGDADTDGGTDDGQLDDESGDDASSKAKPQEKAAEVIQHPAAKKAEPEVKTIGELVDEAKATEAAKSTGKLRLDFPHQIGTWVLVLTDGKNPKEAWIKNMHTDTYGRTWYDLKIPGGEMNDVNAERIQQMPEAMAKDFATVGELERLRALVDAHQRFKDQGEELSKTYYDLLAEEHGIAEELKEKRKQIEKHVEKMAEHGRADVQLDWRDGTAAAVVAVTSLQVEKPKAQKKSKAKKAAKQEEPAVVKEPIEIASLGLEREEILRSRLFTALKEARETGKTAKVKPVTIASQGPFVLDTTDGDCADLRPLYTEEEWAAECQAIYGDPVEEYTEAPPERLKPGGPAFGFVVKAGRKKFIVGPREEALLVRLTPDKQEPEEAVEEALVGKDAAAGR